MKPQYKKPAPTHVNYFIQRQLEVVNNVLNYWVVYKFRLKLSECIHTRFCLKTKKSKMISGEIEAS